MTEAGYMPLRIEEVEGPDALTDALRFRRSMEIDTVGIILFSPDGAILQANNAFLRMTMHTQEDVQAGEVRWDQMTPPEWKAASARALEEFQRTGSASPYEKQYLCKDGSRIWVVVASKRLSEKEGIGFVLNVSERKHAEAQLQQTRMQLERNESQLRTIMDAVPTLMSYVDPWLRYIRVNQAYGRFFGVNPEEVVGRPLREVLDGDFAQVEPFLTRALAGEAQQVEATFKVGQAETRQVISQYIPDLTPEGHLLGLVIQVTDTTESRKAEQVLRTAEKVAAVGKLAASMAHEINNPLEAVTNLLFLARRSEDLETTQVFLEQAENELRRVAEITNQTLRFHKQSTRPVEVRANALLESVLSMYAARLLNGDVAVMQRVRAPQPVQCFEGEIRQVLSNLVSNALDAMRGRPATLHLRSAAATDWQTGHTGVRLTVADTGTGMSRETLLRLWEPFYTTKEVSGTGLGMWISRDIAERNGARLRVRSLEGVGTVVSLWLPMVAAAR